MTWNYRVIENEEMFQIHEVYYNEAGEITAISENPVAPAGESLEELAKDLEHYAEALKKPVLKRFEIVFAAMG
jgi:hypothetical protein